MNIYEMKNMSGLFSDNPAVARYPAIPIDKFTLEKLADIRISDKFALSSKFSGVRLLPSTELLCNGTISKASLPFVVPEQETAAFRQRLRHGDILLPLHGRPISAVMYVCRPDTMPCVAAADIAVIRLTADIDSQLLCRFFNAPIGQSLLDCTRIHGNDGGISAARLKKLIVPYLDTTVFSRLVPSNPSVPATVQHDSIRRHAAA